MGMTEEERLACKAMFYAEYGDYAAHHSNTGRLLGFEVGGTGDEAEE